MDKSDCRYNMYVKILEEELLLATGCTEPISIAYASAKARSTLGSIPDKIEAQISGNIIKNVKSVVVPNTGGMKGIKAAIAAGVIAGEENALLEVIAKIDKDKIPEIKKYSDNAKIEISHLNTEIVFDMIITMYNGNDFSKIRIANNHTNIVHLEKNGKVIIDKAIENSSESNLTDKSVLNVKDIIDFADTYDIKDLKTILDRQIEKNYSIAQEGIHGNYGANIGKMLIATYGDNIKNRARAMAASGSDARMSGCEMPVVIISGSGNQGMTCSVPVIEYAKELKKSEEELHRALVVSDLITIHQKTGIGRLSAYCGAVSAGCGAAAGIAYLNGGKYEVIAHTIVNALAISSGIVCDGAKPSCAAKIALAVETGLIGYNMYLNGNNQFYDGEGIVGNSVDNTIANVGRLACKGMKETDKEIIEIMVSDGSKQENSGCHMKK